MKNLKQVEELIQAYRSVTPEIIKEKLSETLMDGKLSGTFLSKVTGFGRISTCTLCLPISKQCTLCIYKEDTACVVGDNEYTYDRILVAGRKLFSEYKNYPGQDLGIYIHNLTEAYANRAKHIEKIIATS